MAFHWNAYAAADLLITILEYPPRADLPLPITDYLAKVGNHQFRTDHEFITAKGARPDGYT